MYCFSVKAVPVRLLAAGLPALLVLGSPAVPATAAAGPARAAAVPYLDPALPVAARVDDLLSRMSLDDKLGQMTQPERRYVTPEEVGRYRIGSVMSAGGSAPSPNTAKSWADMVDAYQRGALSAPLRIPMMYGVDAVHGDNNVVGATIFPHAIGLGASRDPGLVRRIGAATAEEMAATGADWDFAPCLCVARDDRWGRTYESFGEVPELPSAMTSLIDGLQGPEPGGPASVLATAKHFVGDGGTEGGRDRGDARISEEELRAVHLPPFREAVRRGVGSVMVSYSSWNGVKMHANRYLISGVLKGELGFGGFVVSDYQGVDRIDGEKGMTRDEIAKAVNAGIDMVMVPEKWKDFIAGLRAGVRDGTVPMARVDDANRRILTQKMRFGLFERPMADRRYLRTVGSAAHRALARRAVAESQVLLKNDGVLPLRRDARIFVAGRSADDIGMQSGGWTVTWQGAPGATTPGTTILQGIRQVAGERATIAYDRDGKGIDTSYDAAVAVVGEKPYAEYHGDRPDGLALDEEDVRTIERLRASGVPVAVVLVSGRPLDVASRLGGWNALVASWLPGTEGAGVADVLFGDARPAGRLPVTWPRDGGQEPVNRGDGKEPLFPFGYGLTYGGAAR
ncbi:glycoside hydrolase family 3 C-terminal domain-containing protein [Actinomadura nitritigenes]|uniref:beta-glucosidase n=1 Tax=Actinomadura nitritigenes TaxID=134602 RepID=A0ABS3QW21_9ACTN|nr:glycoside hydrolase family 3 N-terminal domain-containing protein [Actinomadura nitritigenes]MBO2438169.1 glycoside hydrolase family 3 C-terminal domain-containing protein [Actinomadura nitritigenes]